MFLSCTLLTLYLPQKVMLLKMPGHWKYLNIGEGNFKDEQPDKIDRASNCQLISNCQTFFVYLLWCLFETDMTIDRRLGEEAELSRLPSDLCLIVKLGCFQSWNDLGTLIGSSIRICCMGG